MPLDLGVGEAAGLEILDRDLLGEREAVLQELRHARPRHLRMLGLRQLQEGDQVGPQLVGVLGEGLVGGGGVFEAHAAPRLEERKLFGTNPEVNGEYPEWEIPGRQTTLSQRGGEHDGW
jgi:hypothetical protein